MCVVNCFDFRVKKYIKEVEDEYKVPVENELKKYKKMDDYVVRLDFRLSTIIKSDNRNFIVGTLYFYLLLET